MKIRRIALLVPLLVAACTKPAPRPPAVSIEAPASGDTVGSSFTVRLAAAGWTVTPADGQRVDGVGHHHLLLDVDVPGTDAPIGRMPGVVHLGNGAGEYTFENVPPGPHRLIAVPAFGSHVPMPGAVLDTVDVVVRADSAVAAPQP